MLGTITRTDDGWTVDHGDSRKVSTRLKNDALTAVARRHFERDGASLTSG